MKKVEVTSENNLKVKEDATFERCIEFMVRMIEKYSHEMELK